MHVKFCADCGAAEQMKAAPRSPFCTRCCTIKNRMKFQSTRREYRLKYEYGLTLADFAEMVRRQDSACAICFKSLEVNEFAVDHNHDTGEVRALLCHPCNRGLGQFKDDADLLLRAANYIKDHSGNV